MVMRGNCTFYEKVRLAQINGARGLLIVSRERLVSPFLPFCIADAPLVLEIVLPSVLLAGVGCFSFKINDVCCLRTLPSCVLTNTSEGRINEMVWYSFR